MNRGIFNNLIFFNGCSLCRNYKKKKIIIRSVRGHLIKPTYKKKKLRKNYLKMNKFMTNSLRQRLAYNQKAARGLFKSTLARNMREIIFL